MRTTFQLEEIKRKTKNTTFSEQFYNPIEHSQKMSLYSLLIIAVRKL